MDDFHFGGRNDDLDQFLSGKVNYIPRAKNNAHREVWVTEAGETIPYTKLSDVHLGNIRRDDGCTVSGLRDEGDTCRESCGLSCERCVPPPSSIK